MNSMKRQKDMTREDEHPRLVGAQYTSIKNEEAGSKRKQSTAVDVPCGESKVQCFKNNTA